MNRALGHLLCTYRLNWARRTSWGWWDDWDDTVLQTQDSKFEPWRSEAEHATFRSQRLPTILTFTRGWGRNIFVSFKPPRPGNRATNSGGKGSGANHYPRAPAQLGGKTNEMDQNDYDFVKFNLRGSQNNGYLPNMLLGRITTSILSCKYMFTCKVSINCNLLQHCITCNMHQTTCLVIKVLVYVIPMTENQL